MVEKVLLCGLESTLGLRLIVGFSLKDSEAERDQNQSETKVMDLKHF